MRLQHWLFKSEPEAFSIDDLANRPVEPWDGVRNYQARNLLRDRIKAGDLAFLYHSSCKTPGIVGIMEIVREGYPDVSAFDPTSIHFDPGSYPTTPRWFMVDVKFRRRLKRVIPLIELKAAPALAGLPLIRRGNRLSIMPVTQAQWTAVLALE